MGNAQTNAGAVAGLAVRVHRAAMPDGFKRIDCDLHRLSAGATVHIRDKAHPAGIML